MTPSRSTRIKPWHDPKVRAWAFQIAVVALVLWLALSLFSNTLHKMESRGIRTGFGFLDQTAGYGILFSLIPYDETYSYGRTFFVGLLNTLLVSGLGIVTATLVGFVAGVARLSRNWLVARLAEVYVEIFRNVPLLLQVFFWYFAVLQALPAPRQSFRFFHDTVYLSKRGLYLPAPVAGEGFGWVLLLALAGLVAAVALGRWARKRRESTGQEFPVWRAALGLVVGLPGALFLLLGAPLSWSVPELRGFNFAGGGVLLPELVALWFALTVYTGTFIAEIVRSGIQAVSHGQTEAAAALGLRRGQVIRLVVLPQALRVIIPPLTSQYLNLTKNSSLATAIGYPDLVAVFMGTTLNQTGQAVEVVAMTMAVYLAISLSISAVMNAYNRRVALKER
ncbi:amino-acid transporter subunit; membrane component of ABC superfamily [uncultured Alphaproteobacteria bacterium]|uniref:Amino-acid transporter subunit membrane component of ABC superfamily n=1 Tax=uncultured Alphaproteobacteria bacterium TaxID=91750 RepID=A0A212KMD4_9PROT|nr:amino-acid transporter subunit; membrane component of ABC superfamily [uncultured Alphaproteobacteria bacterium]